MTPEEIVASWYDSQFNLIDEKAVNDLIQLIQSALAERTEQCAKICSEMAEEEEDVKRVELMISSADRIATLQEWLATDAKIIQQLNQSNDLLSEKITQLEKEKHELTQKLETVVLDADIDLHRLGFDARCVDCVKGNCPASRKA